MKLSTATKIHEVMIDNMSFYEGEPTIRESYTPRGYGANETCGIVCDDVGDIIRALGYILQDVIDNPVDDSDEEEYTDLALDIQNGFKTDSMGLNTIVY